MSGDGKHRDGHGATERERDEILGAALRRLEIPEHRQGFHTELRAMLATDVAERKATGVEPLEKPRWHTLRRGPVRHPLRWTLGLSAAAAAVLAVFLVVGDLPGTSPQMASAAEVRAAVVHAWASAENISGDLVIRSERVFGKGTSRWAFTLTSRGEFSLIALPRGADRAYDAGHNVERSLDAESNPGEPVFGNLIKGLAPGLPDSSPSTTILDRSLGSVVRALVASGGGTVKETMYRGRPAWLLGTDIRVNLSAYMPPDHLQVTVDRQTGFPVRVVATRGRTFVWESRIEDLRVNVRLPEDAFRLEFPPGMKVFKTDAGFRRVPLARVPTIVGYQPPVASWVPTGYRLTEVAVSRKGSPTGSEGSNPVTGGVVSLSYRRGLDQFLVTTRLVGGDRSAWGDPLATGEGFRDRPERIRIKGGALDGRTVRLLIDPLAVPHLWTMTEDLVVTVSGDLTRAELIRMASSLR